MESSFVNKQIVWAKVKGYPWWPAEIAKLPTSDNNVFKVVFIAEDTHAFLNPKDVRKFMQYYDQCSKKKMRGLAPAIEAAEEIYKKRIEIMTKTPSVSQNEPVSKPSKAKQRPAKRKIIKKSSNKVITEQRQQVESEQSESDSGSGQPEEKEDLVQNESQSQAVVENSQSSQQSQMSEQKFLCESEEKIDRNKIQNLEEGLLKIVEAVKEATYTFTQADYKELSSLLPQELLQSKILNILSFISSKIQTKTTSEANDLRWLNKLRQELKQKTLEYLYDTSYYDQYLKLIQKNKKNRNEYEGKLTSYLKNHYRIKKELSVIFASRLVAQINNGTIVKEKELLEDIRERRAELSNINNKAAIQRCIQALIAKYA